MKKLHLTAVAMLSTAILANPVSAEIITYDVTDGGSHGLFTAGVFQDGSWNFQPGATFVLDTDAGIGSLTGTVINNLGVLSELELEFSGFLDTLDGSGFYYTQGDGAPYNPATQDYFTDASGTFDYQPLGEPFVVNPDDGLTGQSVAQLGVGTNYVNPDEFGLGAWIQFINPTNGKSSNWDVYAALDRRPTDVPEPAPIALLALGLAGLIFSRRRKRLASPA